MLQKQKTTFSTKIYIADSVIENRYKKVNINNRIR